MKAAYLIGSSSVNFILFNEFSFYSSSDTINRKDNTSISNIKALKIQLPLSKFQRTLDIWIDIDLILNQQTWAMSW